MEFYKNARIILLGMALAFSSNLYGLDNKTEILLNIQKNPFVTPCIKIEKLHATDQCSHCHQAFRAGERVTIINECQHLIHTNCIQLIGGEDKTCPHEGCNKLIIKHNYATCLDHMINRPDQYAQFNDLLSTIIKNNRASFPEYSSFLVVSNESNKEHVAPYRNILFKKEALSLLLSSFKNILYYFAKTFPIFYLIDTAKLNINIEFQSIKEISKSQFFRDSGQFDKDIHTSSMDTNFDKFLDIEKVKYMVFDNIFYSMLFHLISIEMIVNHITYREMLRNGINVTGKTIDGVANIYRFLSGRPRINGRHFLNTENLSLQEKDELVNLLKDFLENYIIGYGLSKKAFFFPFIIGMHSGAEILWAPMINNYYLNNPFTTSAGVYSLGKSIWHNFNELRKRNKNTGELKIWSEIKEFVSGGNRPQENIAPQEDEQTQQTNPRPSLWNGLDNKTEILLNIQKNPFVTPCIKIEKLHATDQCSHCHQAFRVGERVTIINECQHLIHTNCIQFIGGENKTCPHEGCNKLIIKHNYATCLDHMINRPDQYAQFKDLLSTIIKNNKASFPEYSSFLVVSNESNKEHVAPYRNILFKKEALSLLLSSFKNILYYFAKTFPIFYLIDTAKLNINIVFQSIKEISQSQFFRDSGQFDKDIHTSSMNTNFDKFLDIEKVKYMVFDNIFYSMLFHLISIEMIVNHITYREMLRNGINVTGKTIDGVANIYRFLSGRPRINGRHFLNTENLSLQEKDKLVNLLKDFLENYIIGYGLSKAFFFPFIIGMHSGAEMLWAPMINNYYLNNPFTTSAGVYALGKSIWHNFNELRKRNENTGELQIWSTIKKFVSGGNRPQENITPQEDEQTQQTNPRPSLWNRFTNYFRR